MCTLFTVIYLEIAVKEQSHHNYTPITERVLVVERSTGNIVGVLGERLGLDEQLAKGISLVATILSSVGERVGAELVSFEVRYSSKLVSVEVRGRDLRIAVTSA